MLDGVTADDGVEEAELPCVFVAKTVKVYGVPFVRFVNVYVKSNNEAEIGLVAGVGDGVTEYPVIEVPPVEVGATHVTVTEPLPMTTPTTPVGAPGTVRGVTGVIDADATDVGD